MSPHTHVKTSRFQILTPHHLQVKLKYYRCSSCSHTAGPTVCVCAVKWHHSRSCCSLVQADQAATRLFTSTWPDGAGGSGAGAAGGGGMTPSLFRIILQTDGQVDQPIRCQHEKLFNDDQFLLQSLWSFLDFSSFGINHGTFYVCVDQTRLMEKSE